MPSSYAKKKARRRDRRRAKQTEFRREGRGQMGARVGHGAIGSRNVRYVTKTSRKRG